MKRRDFLTGASGAGAAVAATTAASQPVLAQEGEDGGGEQRPDWGGWLEGIDGGYEDLRDNDEVTVSVGAEGNGGNYAFEPAGVWVSPNTTVRWEWTGQGGGHNVVEQEGDFGLESGNPVSESGVNYEFTFEEGGLSKYVCQPHESLGMLGAVAVGDDVPTVSVGGEGGEAGPVGAEEMGIPFHPHFVGLGALLMMTVSLVFTFFVLKYGTSPHAKGGND